jgi:hypothetical protein
MNVCMPLQFVSNGLSAGELAIVSSEDVSLLSASRAECPACNPLQLCGLTAFARHGPLATAMTPVSHLL